MTNPSNQVDNEKIAPEIYALIDDLVAQIVARFEATGDGPAALAGEREARKIIHDRVAKGRRASAKQVLYRRFMKAITPAVQKRYADDLAAERRQRELRLDELRKRW